MFHRSVPLFVMLSLCCLAPLGCSEPPHPKVEIEEQKEGDGPAAKSGDLVEIHYTGKLPNGKVFESRVGTATYRFRVGKGEAFISGLDEGLPGMKAGGKRLLTIPPRLAFGEQGSSGRVPPNTTVTFEVELIQIITDISKAKEVAVADLKIEDLKEGEGPAAKTGDTLLVHYTGRLSDGTKFDSSYDRNQPFTPFMLGAGKVIQGWDKGLIGMKAGGKRKLTIPPELAYGVSGSGSTIPPNATLVFEVELLKILK
jgi:FKBP-type peptidyl-prolyl cis-trans isomerase